MELWKTHRADVEFLVVYIREAHATDSAWPMTEPESPFVEEPLLAAERMAIAQRCMSALALRPIPAVVDEIDNRVDAAYEAWPDRLYLVDRNGRIAYRSGPGPFGFDPDELADSISKELERERGGNP